MTTRVVKVLQGLVNHGRRDSPAANCRLLHCRFCARRQHLSFLEAPTRVRRLRWQLPLLQVTPSADYLQRGHGHLHLLPGRQEMMLTLMKLPRRTLKLTLPRVCGRRTSLSTQRR